MNLSKFFVVATVVLSSVSALAAEKQYEKSYISFTGLNLLKISLTNKTTVDTKTLTINSSKTFMGTTHDLEVRANFELVSVRLSTYQLNAHLPSGMSIAVGALLMDGQLEVGGILALLHVSEVYDTLKSGENSTNRTLNLGAYAVFNMDLGDFDVEANANLGYTSKINDAFKENVTKSKHATGMFLNLAGGIVVPNSANVSMFANANADYSTATTDVDKKKIEDSTSIYGVVAGIRLYLR